MQGIIIIGTVFSLTFTFWENDQAAFSFPVVLPQHGQGLDSYTYCELTVLSGHTALSFF